MGTKFSSQATSGYASASPPDDGSQVAANLITWSGVRTKLTDVLKTFAEAINTALVSAMDLSARAISSNDTAIASDHWKTLQVTGATTIQLSSAASMGAGYEVGVFNAGVGVVTVAPAGADTINGVSASVTVAVKGSMIFRTNQALTGYNVVGQSNRMDAGTINGATIGATSPASGAFTTITATTSAQWGTGVANFGTITKRKTADESVTSSTVLQDDDHLTFAIAANEEWNGSIFLFVGSTLSTTGFKVALSVPGGSTVWRSFIGIGPGGTTREDDGSGGSTSFTAATGFGAALQTECRFWILNGATPGNVTLQWAQDTSSGTAVTVRKGSFLDAKRVA